MRIFAMKIAAAAENKSEREHSGCKQWCSKVCVFSRPQVLLVSSSKYTDRWIIPGGGVEDGEKCGAETAVREVLEEAGVTGRLGRCLGVFEVRSTNENT
jgi:8-oxo-dGTP pyrophosphatase MutT (NUDIX family)